MEQVPVIDDIVRVVTIRNYFYSDDSHEMDIDVPKVGAENGDAADYINKNVSELTSALVNQFYKDLEITDNNGYGSIRIDYEVITNTDRWFTLKLSVIGDILQKGWRLSRLFNEVTAKIHTVKPYRVRLQSSYMRQTHSMQESAKEINLICRIQVFVTALPVRAVFLFTTRLYFQYLLLIRHKC